ncbi:MAG: isochorismatase family cysteine hydrolase [Candidatus Woesearchaeota archaeon]
MKDMLVIVDVQNGFMNDNTRQVIPRINSLLKKKLFDHVVFTQFVNSENSPYERFIKWNGMKTQEETDIVDELKPYVEKSFVKHFYTCFTAEFEDYLSKKQIGRLFFVGVDTNICVTKCAVDTFERSMPGYVLGHYCASHSGKHLHEFALENLEKFIGGEYVLIKTIEEIP